MKFIECVTNIMNYYKYEVIYSGFIIIYYCFQSISLTGINLKPPVYIVKADRNVVFPPRAG